MARPYKKGLDYFPMDVDFFEDDKIQALENQFGPLGVRIYEQLLHWTYKNGYYYEFATLDLLTVKMIRAIGNRWLRDKKTVEKVILYCAEINLVDAGLVRQNVITSKGIQRRYLTATERRQFTYGGKYWLVDENGEPLESAPFKKVNVGDNSVNVYNNSVNVSDKYTKKRKVKKSKVNERRRYPAGKRFRFHSFKYTDILKKYAELCTGFPQVRKLSDKHILMLKAGIKEFAFTDYTDLFEKAAESDFLSKTKKSWSATFEWLIKPANMTKVINGDYDNWNDKQNSQRDNTADSSFDTDDFFEAAVKRTYEKAAKLKSEEEAP